VAFTLGTDSANGVPISVQLAFNGVAVNWGGDNLYSMSPLSNRAESVDGSYELTDLDVELIDTNGSIWGSLGNGTSAFYKPFSATVYVGGRLEWETYGPVGKQRVAHLDNVGAATYTVHTGQIVEVAKKDRKVRIKSQNNLRALEDMEWRFPYSDSAAVRSSMYGSYAFVDYDFRTYWPKALYAWNEDRDSFSLSAGVGTRAAVLSVDYPSIANRGTMGLLYPYTYPGTQFYADFPLVKFTGTFLGTYAGTITSGTDANNYGYAGLVEAEAARSGTRYVINKTRLHVQDGTLPLAGRYHLQQNLTLEETPANLFRELIAGHCVSPYFGTTDIEQSNFGTSQMHTAYLTFSQRIDPKGGKVLPYLKDLINSIYGQFSVNQDNKFELKAYGPRNLTASIGTVDGTTLLDSSFRSNREDAKNRVVLKYAYSTDTNSYNKAYELTGTPWAGTIDNPVVIQSKWIQNDDEARTFTQRILNRFKNTSPRIDLSVSMKHAGVNLGTLLVVNDPDSGLSNKVVEVVGYTKDFTDGRKIDFSCIDGESVYSRKGFGQWMSGASLPSGDVSGTSTFGFGTSGTMANINVSTYGTQFTWF
jgi:hypothetical protein